MESPENPGFTCLVKTLLHFKDLSQALLSQRFPASSLLSAITAPSSFQVQGLDSVQGSAEGIARELDSIKLSNLLEFTRGQRGNSKYSVSPMVFEKISMKDWLSKLDQAKGVEAVIFTNGFYYVGLMRTAQEFWTVEDQNGTSCEVHQTKAFQSMVSRNMYPELVFYKQNNSYTLELSSLTKLAEQVDRSIRIRLKKEKGSWICKGCKQSVKGDSYECLKCRVIDWDQFYKVKSLRPLSGFKDENKSKIPEKVPRRETKTPEHMFMHPSQMPFIDYEENRNPKRKDEMSFSEEIESDQAYYKFDHRNESIRNHFDSNQKPLGSYPYTQENYQTSLNARNSKPTDDYSLDTHHFYSGNKEHAFLNRPEGSEIHPRPSETYPIHSKISNFSQKDAKYPESYRTEKEMPQNPMDKLESYSGEHHLDARSFEQSYKKNSLSPYESSSELNNPFSSNPADYRSSNTPNPPRNLDRSRMPEPFPETSMNHSYSDFKFKSNHDIRDFTMNYKRQEQPLSSREYRNHEKEHTPSKVQSNQESVTHQATPFFPRPQSKAPKTVSEPPSIINSPEQNANYRNLESEMAKRPSNIANRLRVPEVSKEDPDWLCPACGTANIISATTCWKCNGPLNN